MTKVGLRELKNRLGTYIAKVRAGETVVITDRGEVVAELKPPTITDNPVLDEMVRRGEARLGKPIKDREAFYRPIPGPVLKGITSQEILDELREENWMSDVKKPDESLR
jgi:antitoxin (DNA-binding transcriptional repressor) of toxin-antitoxin stability system